MKTIITLTLMLFYSNSFATTKIELKELNKKETKAILLINKVNEQNNLRFSNEEDKMIAQDAYRNFITNYQKIKDELVSYEQKELIPDDKAIGECSQKLDNLIKDMQIFLNS